MNKELEILYAYLKTIKDFRELLHLKFSKKKSGEAYKVYKLTYLNDTDEEVVLQIELNQKKEKLSFGLWNSTALQTIKFKHFLEA